MHCLARSTPFTKSKFILVTVLPQIYKTNPLQTCSDSMTELTRSCKTVAKLHGMRLDQCFLLHLLNLLPQCTVMKKYFPFISDNFNINE
jgi:hypothetical protein